MSKTKTYRDANTGIIREYPPSLAAVFPSLIEVDEDAPCYTCGEAESESADTITDATDSDLEWDEEDAPEEEEEA